MVVFCFVLRLSVESNGGRVLVLHQSKPFTIEPFHRVEKNIPMLTTRFNSWYPDVLGGHANADARIIVPYSSPV